jgi:hypothetical protein
VDWLIDFAIELFIDAFGEGLGWLVDRRWGRLLLGLCAAAVAGIIWTWAGHTDPPLIGSALIAVQALTVPFVAGRRVLGRTVAARSAIELTAIGAAAVGTRWLSWAML